jgi:hypothetical protein
MIMSPKPQRAVPTLLAGAILAVAFSVSFLAPARADAAKEDSYLIHDANFAALFPSGIVATVCERKITVFDVQHEVARQIGKIQKAAKTQEEFDLRLDIARNEAVQRLVKQALYVQQFREHGDGQAERHVPEEFIDTQMADELSSRFNNDPAKREEFLKARGWTLADERKALEEQIIFNYMAHQQKRLEAKIENPR